MASKCGATTYYVLGFENHSRSLVVSKFLLIASMLSVELESFPAQLPTRTSFSIVEENN